MFAKFFSRFKKSTPGVPVEDAGAHTHEEACECGADEGCGGECDNAGGCGCGKKEEGECCGNGCC